ncbi:MAG TPA: hypothetical protein VKV74_06940 [Bryobacteraceae bacterium]|nr:hypothetical protein [Bryobacteraceae bacterium]
MKFFVAAACSAILCGGADLPRAAAPSGLEEGYRKMYNLQFDEAHRIFQQWQSDHPEDPMGPASEAAAYLFSELDRLHILQSEFFTDDDHFAKKHKLSPDLKLKGRFQEELARAGSLAAEARDEPNSMFATIMQHGLQSDYLALIEKRYLPALNETKQASAVAEKLLEMRPDYHDANLAIGVENYLLSLKPAPVRWLLRAGGAQTDRQAGIEKLRLTEEKGHYLVPFAKILLAVAALRDKNREAAEAELSWLAEQFPLNRLFREELAKLQ